MDYLPLLRSFPNLPLHCCPGGRDGWFVQAAVLEMPGSTFWAIMFFAMLLTLGFVVIHNLARHSWSFEPRQVNL
jgi:hypothetical protein